MLRLMPQKRGTAPAELAGSNTTGAGGDGQDGAFRHQLAEGSAWHSVAVGSCRGGAGRSPAGARMRAREASTLFQSGPAPMAGGL